MKIYLSYARADYDAVQRIADLLRVAGHEPASDRDLLPGVNWDAAIERMIDEAEAVIVIWSAHAAASQFLVAEASTAFASGKYLGVVLGKVDLPMPFGVVQHLVLQSDGTEPRLGVLAEALRHFGERAKAPRASNRNVREASKRQSASAPPPVFPSPPRPQSQASASRYDEDVPPFLQREIPRAETTPPVAMPEGPPMGVFDPLTSEAPGYDVFISYSRKDTDACKLVFNFLAERGLQPWYDKDIGSGAFKQKIVTRISQAAVFVLLLSRNSVASQNVSKELSVASSSDRLIIPISIDGIGPDELNDTFRYELIELNIFQADPKAPESWTDVIKTIADSVVEVRGAVPSPIALPVLASSAAATKELRRPYLFAGVTLLGAVVQQAALGVVLYLDGHADAPRAIAAAIASGALFYPLAFASAALMRLAFRRA